MLIDPSGQSASVTTQRVSSSASAAPSRSGSVFRLVKSTDDRITGSIPVWGKPLSPQEEVTQTLSASTSRVSPDTNMALALSGSDPLPEANEEFGFLDLIDMVNPLQHIPVVGSIYRAITGDQIKPISQIVGGAAFGGALGAAGGIVNAMVTHETGKDIGGNVMGMMFGPAKAPAATASTDTTIALASLSYKQPHYNE